MTLSVDGTEVASEVVESPDGHVFELKTPLALGQEISVTQTLLWGGSEPTSVMVRDHKLDHPDGLPPPSIRPTPIYECASAIATSNVPGATLFVRKHAADGHRWHKLQESGRSRTWIRMDADGTFEVGDAFEVRQQLCQDLSPYSEQVVAATAPDSLPKVTIPAVMEGQEFVTLESIEPGSQVSLREHVSSTLVLRSDSVPLRRLKNINLQTSPLDSPYDPGFELRARQRLCDVLSDEGDTPELYPCSTQTIAPEIAPPVHGDDFVLITKGIPGAAIRVFDPGMAEIGNGSGSSIPLTRPLVAGETIAVMQSLPTCPAHVAFVITVQ